MILKKTVFSHLETAALFFQALTDLGVRARLFTGTNEVEWIDTQPDMTMIPCVKNLQNRLDTKV